LVRIRKLTLPNVFSKITPTPSPTGKGRKNKKVLSQQGKGFRIGVKIGHFIRKCPKFWVFIQKKVL